MLRNILNVINMFVYNGNFNIHIFLVLNCSTHCRSDNKIITVTFSVRCHTHTHTQTQTNIHTHTHTHTHTQTNTKYLIQISPSGLVLNTDKRHGQCYSCDNICVVYASTDTAFSRNSFYSLDRCSILQQLLLYLSSDTDWQFLSQSTDLAFTTNSLSASIYIASSVNNFCLQFYFPITNTYLLYFQ